MTDPDLPRVAAAVVRRVLSGLAFAGIPPPVTAVTPGRWRFIEGRLIEGAAEVLGREPGEWGEWWTADREED